jgi:hypothetical protein
MKISHFALALGLLAAVPAHAEDNRELAALAAETGLTERELRMALGTRTAFAEYRTAHDRVLRKVERALEERRAARDAEAIATRQ